MTLGSAARAQSLRNGFSAAYAYQLGDLFAPEGPLYIWSPRSGVLQGWNVSLEHSLASWAGLQLIAGERYGSVSSSVGCGTALPGCTPTPLHTQASQRTILFGPAIFGGDEHVTLLAHALVGRAQMNEKPETFHSVAYLLGAGFDFGLSRRIAIRVEGNELHTNYLGATDSQNYLVATTGLVARF